MPKTETTERISDSTIARIAGNLMSGWVRERRPGESVLQPADIDERAVERSVKLAKLIAAEVERTRP